MIDLLGFICAVETPTPPPSYKGLGFSWKRKSLERVGSPVGLQNGGLEEGAANLVKWSRRSVIKLGFVLEEVRFRVSP